MHVDLANKLEHHEAKENQFEDILKHKQLEMQLCEAKLAQQTIAMAKTKESNLVEKEYLLTEMIQQQRKCEDLTQQEADLWR